MLYSSTALQLCLLSMKSLSTKLKMSPYMGFRCSGLQRSIRGQCRSSFPKAGKKGPHAANVPRLLLGLAVFLSVHPLTAPDPSPRKHSRLGPSPELVPDGPAQLPHLLRGRPPCVSCRCSAHSLLSSALNYLFQERPLHPRAGQGRPTNARLPAGSRTCAGLAHGVPRRELQRPSWGLQRPSWGRESRLPSARASSLLWCPLGPANNLQPFSFWNHEVVPCLKSCLPKPWRRRVPTAWSVCFPVFGTRSTGTDQRPTGACRSRCFISRPLLPNCMATVD